MNISEYHASHTCIHSSRGTVDTLHPPADLRWVHHLLVASHTEIRKGTERFFSFYAKVKYHTVVVTYLQM